MYLIKYRTIKTYGGVEVYVFLTWAIYGCEWLASRLNRVTLGTQRVWGTGGARGRPAQCGDEEKRLAL
jgi:hypothetical protein